MDSQDRMILDKQRKVTLSKIIIPIYIGSSPIGALAAAYNGGIAATSIIDEWYN